MLLKKVMSLAFVVTLVACGRGKNKGQEVTPEEFDQGVAEIIENADTSFTRAKMTSKQRGKSMGQTMSLDFYATYEKVDNEWMITEDNNVPAGFNAGEVLLECTIDNRQRLENAVMSFGYDYQVTNHRQYIKRSGAIIKSISIVENGVYIDQEKEINMKVGLETTWDNNGYLTNFVNTANGNVYGTQVDVSMKFSFTYFK